MRSSSKVLTAFYGLLAGSILFTLPSQGAMVLNSLSGVSRYEEVATSPTTNRLTAYGGFAEVTGTCDTSTGTVCNTCKGKTIGDKLAPCNTAAVYPGLKIKISVTTNLSPTPLLVDAKVLVGTNSITSGSLTMVNSTLNAEFLWSDLCTAAGKTSCTDNINATLSIGFRTAGSTTGDLVEKYDIQFISSYIDTTTTDLQYYQSCEDGVTTPTSPSGAPYGICYMEADRGDGKLYIDPTRFASGYPTFRSNVPYKGIRVFYEPASDTTNLSNESPFVDFDLIGITSDLADNRVQGLENGVKYCTVLANRDVTGNIFYFTPTNARVDPVPNPADSTKTLNGQCNTPDQVAGLLDDKSCFIATAAFGTEMSPKVKVLRAFRDRFLLPYSWGQSFVRTYYKLSPPLAQFISEHETLRAGTRAMLWPVLLWSEFTLAWGLPKALLITFLFSFLLGIGIFQVRRRFVRGKAEC